jgi:hypothetical protein
MAVGGASGIAAAAEAAGCGGWKDGTSHDQPPRASAIGARPTAGNPRSRAAGVLGRRGGARRAAVVDGGGGGAAPLLYIYRFVGGEDRGQKFSFGVRISLFCSPCSGVRVDGEPFGIGFCSCLARLWFEIQSLGPCYGGGTTRR